MYRLFNESRSGETAELGGRWDLAAGPEDGGLREKWHIEFPRRSEKICVPGVWDRALGRPRTFSNNELVTGWRRPTVACWTVGDAYCYVRQRPDK